MVLLTCLEALLGAINTCLPVMRPVLTKLINLNTSSSLTSSIVSSRAWIRLRAWSSPQLRFVDDNKSANAMSTDHSSPFSSVTLSEGAPRSPPKSLYHQPERPEWDEKSGAVIVVQRDWDVERGDSAERDTLSLKGNEGGYNRGW